MGAFSMKPNLNGLRSEIEAHLAELGLAIFHGRPRNSESAAAIYWDCDRSPDYKLFLKAAATCGVKLVVYHMREFSLAELDDALDELTSCELDRDELREYERRLSKLRVHDGAVCEIELSYDVDGRVYIFNLSTDWYDELSELQDEIRMMSVEADEDDSPLGGYFSKN